MTRTIALAILLQLPAVTPAADPLAGRWSVYWQSDANGHRGPLRATVTPSPAGYEVRFSGRLAKVITFVYRQHLDVVGVSGDAVALSATRRIPLFGTFPPDAVATPTSFDATFRSGKDSGRFVLGR
ncbi:MAG: hypothetical protein ABGY75_14905 [Gemmataceae bacterium]